MFDARKVTNQCIIWIRKFFEESRKDCNAVVGISGGKDSSVVAALCVEALGKERVIGVMMPCGKQQDIYMSYKLVQHLGIKHYEINIQRAVEAITESIAFLPEMTEQAQVNLPARVRMATLYAVSQSMNGRVANTCNLSEDWVGYATRYGDGAGDFSPLCNLTVTLSGRFVLFLVPSHFFSTVRLITGFFVFLKVNTGLSTVESALILPCATRFPLLSFDLDAVYFESSPLYVG